MKKFVLAAALASFVAAPAFAQTAAPATAPVAKPPMAAPATPAPAAKPAEAAKPMAAKPMAAKPAMSAADKKAKSADCSKQADAKSLHGKDRKKFREECKRG